MKGDQRWGTVEISFVPAGPSTLRQWLTQPWVLVMLTLGAGAFILFSLYLRRAFEYLDPQSVLPERIRSAFDAFSEGVMVIDPAGRVILANSTIRKWLGKDGASIHGRAVRKINALNAALPIRPADHPWMRAMKQGTSIKGEYIDLEVQEGDLRKLSVNCSPVMDHDSAVRGCIVTFDDITEIQRVNAQLLEALEELKLSREEIEKRNKALQQMAMHDVLTGCLNRRAFFETATPAFQQAHDQGQRITCIMIDIDHFKSFNDRFGHQVGDEVLKVTARILSGGVRSDDVLCRYGGEEFCIVMPRTGFEEAARVAEQLRMTIESRAAKNVRGLKDASITASFGVCEFAQHKSFEDLIRDADKALYVAKEEGRNRVKLHKPTLQAVSA
jgi:diguanylate cyclase (GGDEF)-like protein/PAS domain S-box-containing protein